MRQRQRLNDVSVDVADVSEVHVDPVDIAREDLVPRVTEVRGCEQVQAAFDSNDRAAIRLRDRDRCSRTGTRPSRSGSFWNAGGCVINR